MTLYLDLDGTIANLYGVAGWLQDLNQFSTRPYVKAKPLCNMSALARALNKAQKKGYSIGVISWLSKTSTEEYDREVTRVKQQWLKRHLKSVHFDEIHIVSYGTPKSAVARDVGILFDDEQPNRAEWNRGRAFPPEMMFEIIKNLA